VSGGRPPGGPDRFPGFDVLSQASHWDAVTSGVVLSRLAPPEPLRFFTPAEAATAAALFDQLLDQRAEPRVPVLSMVDARLADGQTDGWRYDDMPDDGTAFQLSLAGLDADARRAGGTGFDLLGWEEQAGVVGAVQRSDGTWRRLPASRVWSLWTRYACTAFYSHPWAWSEIGFGGPAYPRGYGNLGMDRREHWEERDSGATVGDAPA
jgi:hypothetical protein